MCSRLRSPMVSGHEHNWGQLGPGGCHALRACGLPWSPIMNTIGAIGVGWVSRASGPVVFHGFLMMSAIGAIGAGWALGLRSHGVVFHGLRL